LQEPRLADQASRQSLQNTCRHARVFGSSNGCKQIVHRFSMSPLKRSAAFLICAFRNPEGPRFSLPSLSAPRIVEISSHRASSSDIRSSRRPIVRSSVASGMVFYIWRKRAATRRRSAKEKRESMNDRQPQGRHGLTSFPLRNEVGHMTTRGKGEESNSQYRPRGWGRGSDPPPCPDMQLVPYRRGLGPRSGRQAQAQHEAPGA
jgi:hypothetical protein